MEMEVEEIQENPNASTDAIKFSRIGNGRPISVDDDGENRQSLALAAITNGGGGNRLRGWHHSSRIIRVSRASGGKDRHSKVWTSKGLRDRRVRLSVTTAIQFYDLQDRLGYDQPSKAVEWLINAAADSISELPSLNSSAFPETPKQFSDDQKRPSPSSAAATNAAENHHSSTSETSKGSGLSLSRSDVRVNRVKARERARERASKDNNSINPSTTQSQNTSFTQLLTSGITSNNNGGYSASPREENHHHNNHPMVYLSERSQQHHQLQASLPMLPPPFGLGLGGGGEATAEQYSFVPEQHLMPSGGGGDISSGSQNFWIGAGFNRGTLQSNNNNNTLHSHSLNFHNHHLFQRFSNDGVASAASIPFLFGAAAAETAHHHQQLSAGFDSRLHFCYGADHKGKGKN